MIIHTDGGSRGNPGPAAIGIVFSCDDKVLHSYYEKIGVATNNQAEYQAIIKALRIIEKSNWLKENRVSEEEIVCKLDSQLVVEQINGNYKVKNEEIKIYMNQIKQILENVDMKVKFIHIPREENKKADKLVNKALDEK